MNRIPFATMAVFALLPLATEAGATKRNPANANEPIYHEWVGCTIPDDLKPIGKANFNNTISLDLGESSPREVVEPAVNQEYLVPGGKSTIMFRMKYYSAADSDGERVEVNYGLSKKEGKSWQLVMAIVKPFAMRFPIDPRTTYQFRLPASGYNPVLTIDCELRRKRVSTDCADCRSGN